MAAIRREAGQSWTQGFQYGCAILQYDMTGEERFLELGRNSTVTHMAPHVSHIGVHDHGFNNLSTYGNLRRLMLEGRVEFDQKELDFYELAIKVSGAVQAARWTEDGRRVRASSIPSTDPTPCSPTPCGHCESSCWLTSSGTHS